MPKDAFPLPSTSKKMNVLLVGGGGREHALAWRLKKSPSLGRLFTTHPENPGIAAMAAPTGFPFSTTDYRLELFCKSENIGLVVIGPEGPLAEGLADKLSTDTTAVFGPGKEAAQLESDKAWAKDLMRAASIPTAEGRVFRDASAATRYLESRDTSYVVKACGLASGKGVVVAETLDEARDAVDRIMVKRQFGAAGDKVLIEERLTGKEVSVFALTDGRNVVILDACQDHKRLLDNDDGPNTGGMGAFCPAGTIDAKTMAFVQREVVVATIDAMRRDDLKFSGLLYCGLMLTPGGPKVLEFNVRFGDPECQCLVRRMNGDWVRLLHGASTGKLHEVAAEAESSNEHVCCIVLAARGYPSNPEKGREITGIDAAEKVEGVTVFHAGTVIDKVGRLVTAGGRVIDVVATGATLEEARARAMQAAELVKFEGRQFRSDIGVPAVPKTRSAKVVTPRGVRAG
jgi:phosphoribosylamine--glycine ligase